MDNTQKNFELRTTEQDSHYDHLEIFSTRQLLTSINSEDKTVPMAVEKSIPQIENCVNGFFLDFNSSGRLFYIGSGTSGRLAIVDASECPPTFGVDFNKVIGIIAGGEAAIRKAQEGAEDDISQAWKDLAQYQISPKDAVIGLSASGTTPYVLGGLIDSKKNGIKTGCIVCNLNSPIAEVVDYPIEVLVGPEFVTGSTRMKSGTAQKLVLNMISTSLMIKIGKIKGNKMVDMQLSNKKLVERGTKMLMEIYGWDYIKSNQMLLEFSSVRNVINHIGI